MSLLRVDGQRFKKPRHQIVAAYSRRQLDDFAFVEMAAQRIKNGVGDMDFPGH